MYQRMGVSSAEELTRKIDDSDNNDRIKPDDRETAQLAQIAKRERDFSLPLFSPKIESILRKSSADAEEQFKKTDTAHFKSQIGIQSEWKNKEKKKALIDRFVTLCRVVLPKIISAPTRPNSQQENIR